MRAALRFITSLGGTAVLSGIALGLLAGALFGDLRNTLIAIAVLTAVALVALGIRAVVNANRTVDRIFREELGGGDPFAKPYPNRDDDTTGETR